MKFKTNRKRLPRRGYSPALASALRQISEERVKNGFRNEALLIEALREDPETDETLPPWFCGARAATRDEDLHSGIDLFARVWVKGRGGVPQHVGIPVNAKSSDFGAEMFQKHSKHANRRRKRGAIPIVAFVVDAFAGKPKIRADFFAALLAHGELRAWLGRNRLSFDENPPEKAPPKPKVDRSRVDAARAFLERKIAEERVLRLSVLRRKVRLTAWDASQNMPPGPTRGATIAAIVALARDQKLLRVFESVRGRVNAKVRAAIEAAHREATEATAELEMFPSEVSEKCARIFARSWRTVVPGDGTTLHRRRFLSEAKIAVKRALRTTATPT